MPKAKYNIEIKLDAFYEIDADISKEEAIERALQWFDECEPEIIVNGEEYE